MRFTFLRLAPLWATLSASSPLHAAASLLVDDAGTTPQGTCQLESWTRHAASHLELTAVPACTLGGTELSLGLGHLRGEGTLPWALGAKRALRHWHGERLQLAASIETAGDVRQAGARSWALNLPLSVALGRQSLSAAHFNAGWSRSRHERGITLGAGIDIRIAASWSLLAEQARDAARHRSSQLGIRRHLRGEASLDLLAGRADGRTATSWITVGLNLPLSR
jgi:hypothetical protein